ncbi:hypothetical protein T12_15002 [Trichinella patagoniensis]|uniref:Uncharacterized protein n=1 Tax=Trichinella patagoniensis TaxID=990121 RepID=A0A0V0ZZB1_9BILA|nr:hypothetical protein T12_15002 [Trichinella patagoniensis]
MRLYISIGTGTVDKLFDKILDNVLGSSRFHELFSRFLMDSSGQVDGISIRHCLRHVVFSDKNGNRNPSNYECVEESKYNVQFPLKQIGSKLIQDHYPEQRSIFALGDESMRIQYEEQMSEAHFKRNTVRKR